MFSVKNKVFLVTGAGGGLGKTICNELEKRDAVVIRGIHHTTHEDDLHLHLEINDSSSIEKALTKIRNNTDRLDVLVNSAGITKQGYDNETWNNTIDTNLSSVFFLCKRVKEIFMEKQYSGNIINISSICAHQGFSNNPSYNVSKAGLVSLTKSLANDWIKFNIRVNCITPGYFKTKMTSKNSLIKFEYEKRQSRISMKRYGNPTEITGPIIFLASSASSYITGTEIIVDGGFLSKGV